MGDFNETMYGSEHFCRNPRSEWQMRAFREVIEDCSLQDMGWTGVPFTWDNREAGQANVKARLDRALANEEFRQRYEHTSVRHISTTESDHCLVLAEFRESLNGVRLRPKQFRYENVWQSHVDYDKIVTDSWLKNQASKGFKE
jgi:endonuclease/exonuclease/phosphatase family metal-dependent hydrolase